MPYRPPLLPYVPFPAEPPALPVRTPRDLDGLDLVSSAEVLEERHGAVVLRAALASGAALRATIAIVAPGTARVLVEDETRMDERVRLARPGPGAGRVALKRTEGGLTLGSELLRVHLDLEPFRLRFSDASGRRLLEQSDGDRDVVGRLRTLPLGVTSLGGRRVAFHDSFGLAPDEHVYGFGEKFGEFDKRGQRIESWNYDALGVGSERAYKNAPFFLSTRGYGLFVDSTTAVTFDVGATNHATTGIVVPDVALDYYVIAGPDPKAIICRYAALVGYPVVPRKWAFGLWVSSDFVRDGGAELVRERARLLDEYRIPSDVLHLDAQWQRWGSWSDLEWNTDLFPDPAGLIADLRTRGLKVCVWINPYLGHESDAFREASAGGYLLTTPDGRPYVVDLWNAEHPPVGIIDMTNPEALAWFRARLRRLLEIGVDVFKTDFGEGVPADAVAWNGMTGATLHNLYPLLYNDAVADETRAVTGRPGFVWARSSFAGGQRHAAQWAGDPNCSYADMAAVLRGGLSIAATGHAFWSHDIGGFHGTPTPDLYVRWAQFGLLSPLARVHGNTTRAPWDFGEEALGIFRRYATLRYRLLPYIYSYGLLAGETGLPLLRPMLLEYPHDPATYAVDLQYMLGSELLVAPILDPDGRRTVYFPEGTWIDYWTRQPIVGGRHRTVDAPLDVLPLYVRADALIPTVEDLTRLPHENLPFDFVTFDAYLAARAEFELRDVDGVTHVSALRDGPSLSIALAGAKDRVGLRVVAMDGAAPVERVVVNGREIPRVDALPPGPGGPARWSQDAEGQVRVVALRD